MIPDELCLTPSATRILHRAQVDSGPLDIDTATGHLVAALLQEESLASGLLRKLGVSIENIPGEIKHLAEPELLNRDVPEEETSQDMPVAQMMLSLPVALQDIVGEARRIVRRDIGNTGLSSEHLLAATLQFNTPVCYMLEQRGVTSEGVLKLSIDCESGAKSIPVSFTLGDEFHQQDQTIGSVHANPSPGRVLDACLNRAREGIRVLEDYARFVLNNHGLVQDLKDLRHRLAACERSLAPQFDTTGSSALSQRNIADDVGTDVSGSQEHHRSQMPDIVHANARRVQESLRSLEEFGKLVSIPFAEEMKQLRYQAYDLHRQMLPVEGHRTGQQTNRKQRLQSAHLCVLVTESGCHQPWKHVIEACLQGGADVIQLREKQLSDQELLRRARWMTDACQASGALSIVNDRPDIARISGADGVHLGQDDCGVADARQMLGPELLIGLSTHSVDDFQSADAADYLGVGPVFPSITKHFDSVVGTNLLSETSVISQPWFAIGGIDQDNIATVIASGARRIAVSSVVIAADEPECIVRTLRDRLTLD